MNADIELELDDSTVEMSKKCRSVDDGRQEARRTSLLLCLIRVATMIAEVARPRWLPRLFRPRLLSHNDCRGFFR